MGIAKHKPTAEPDVKPNLPKVQADNSKSVIYDDKQIPLHSLIAYIEGAPWSVDYYGQIVSEHNDLREIDPGQSGSYQQYTKIHNLEIKVTSALTSSYDAATGITKVIGSGNLYPFMTPNVSDYFVTNTSDNKSAILRVTSVNRSTFNRDSVYNIEYEITGYVDALPLIYSSLEEKSVKKLHFSKDRLLEGLQPILKTDDFNKVSNLKSLYQALVKEYYRLFFNRNFRTLVVPGQQYAIYDHYVVWYLKQIVSTTDADEVRDIQDIPTLEDNIYLQNNFWYFFFNRDYNSRLYSNQEMGAVSKNMFLRSSPYILSIGHSNIDYVIYPNNPDTSHLVGKLDQVRLVNMETILETTAHKGTPGEILDNLYSGNNKSYMIIHPVLKDNSYVLSKDFYDNTEQQSVLEILVRDYLQTKTLDLNMLTAVATRFRTWKRLEQFYYGPIVLTLVKAAWQEQYGH